ncbi:hypothetical protein HYH02_003769 [Chlamydomonas schloesseri]|uniref:Uncharacterized protein n=1 Tax=Chlamydomonas schloesseri TaxID=2026947 RepID=A0A836B8U0_9CHLO|nr:hypothetical protein HYH02_003769 [Chlamydomonas schloesseri]|eukprot:KAG2451161.1 hypothetical protein HYH02_003769 [Chlamydomonas schloesseri]
MADASKQHPTPVAEDWNWTARIRNELGANKAWERNWGFLVEQSSAASPDSLAAFMAKTKAAAGDKGLETMSYIAAKQRDSARAATRAAREATLQRQTQQQGAQPAGQDPERGGAGAGTAAALRHKDSLDGFVAGYLPRDAKTRKLPAQEFRKPLTTNHNYGWGRNLEVFGQMTLVLK